MTLATKNGAVIVKDGKVAENCGCCGGWWCYGGCGCSDVRPSVLSATLSFSLNQVAYGQVGTGAFGGGGFHQCAKYTSDSFSDVSKTVSLSYTGESDDGASCFYQTPIVGEYTFQPSQPISVGFVFMKATISCTAVGTSLSITELNYSARPFRGLNQVFVPNDVFYAIKAPCQPETYDQSLLVYGINSAFIGSPDLRSERVKVFSPPCPNKVPLSSPATNADRTCSAFGDFRYELVQWTPVSSDLLSTVASPMSVGELTITI